MPEQREIAGLSCGDVLEALSDYADGALPPDVVERVHLHLAGCTWCEQFGRRFQGILGDLRRELGPAQELDPAVAARLSERLEEEEG